MPNNNSIRIRAYQLGTGECFLIQFADEGESRSILVDCGAGPSQSPQLLDAVARDIQQETGGRIDGLMVTHDHLDRVSGFFDQKQTFGEMSVEQIWLNPLLKPNLGDDRLAKTLRRARSRIDEFVEMAKKEKWSVAKFNSLLRNNMSSESHLAAVRDLAQSRSKIQYIKRGSSVSTPFSENVSLNIHGPVLPAGGYDSASEFEKLTMVQSRLEARLSSSSSRSHPIFGNGFKIVETPAHLAVEDWHVLHEKNFAFGEKEVSLLDNFVDNTSLVFSITIGDKVLFFASDSRGPTWEFCNVCWDSEDYCPECILETEEMGRADFCKASARDPYEASEEAENRLDFFKSDAKILVSAHNEDLRATASIIKEFRSGIIVLNDDSRLWTDITI